MGIRIIGYSIYTSPSILIENLGESLHMRILLKILNSKLCHNKALNSKFLLIKEVS